MRLSRSQDTSAVRAADDDDPADFRRWSLIYLGMVNHLRGMNEMLARAMVQVSWNEFAQEPAIMSRIQRLKDDDKVLLVDACRKMGGSDPFQFGQAESSLREQLIGMLARRQAVEQPASGTAAEMQARAEHRAEMLNKLRESIGGYCADRMLVVAITLELSDESKVETTLHDVDWTRDIIYPERFAIVASQAKLIATAATIGDSSFWSQLIGDVGSSELTAIRTLRSQAKGSIEQLCDVLHTQ